VHPERARYFISPAAEGRQANRRREATMSNRLNLFGALLFTASVTVLGGAAMAQDIASGMLCSRKVAANSWHVCGAVPFKEDGTRYEGPITYEAAGSHEVTVFTTGAIGIQSSVDGLPIGKWSAFDLSEAGVEQIQRSLRPGELGQIEVSTGDLVYVARADHMVTDRTVGVVFLDVPDDPGVASPLSDARIFIEFNVTTEDLGIRASLEGEPWDSVQVIGPDRRILQVSGVRKPGSLGLSELTFAAHAPSLEELLAVFPEGEYEFRGTTVEGDRLLGTATLTHDIPDGPVVLTPEEGVLVDPDAAVISWDPVTEPAGIEIAGYRVTVERGDRGRSLSFELSPETTNVLVPPDFLEPGTDYLFQVFAIEVGGNQTITEGVFDTADAGLGDAQDIKVNDVCQKKIKPFSEHLCGTAPAVGLITLENVGPHEASVYTTDSLGFGTKMYAEPSPMLPSWSAQAEVSKGDRVYLERADNEFTDRTLAIKFTAVP
jgi:Fibronectin type III domain